MRTNSFKTAMLAFVATAACMNATASHAQSAPTCSAKSAARVPTVIELYTSEGV